MKTVRKFFNRGYEESLIGVEIEVEGYLLPEEISGWISEEDGSLRGAENIEYVLRKPQNRKGLETHLKKLSKTLKDQGAVIDMSRRTSTHVHINCGDLTLLELANFTTLLFIYEELLIDWCGKSRRGNLFCLQSKDAEDILDTITQFWKNGSRVQLGDNIRYSAINLASLNKYGSVELRALYGTVDTKTILTWVDALLHLKEMAKKYDTPAEILMEASFRGTEDFAKEALPKEFLKGKAAYRKVLDGIRRVQNLVFLPDWDAKWMHAPEKKVVGGVDAMEALREKVALAQEDDGLREVFAIPHP